MAQPNRTCRIHVVGCHRSGTTLMTELIGNCFAVDARADHEQSLWEPGPAGVATYLTKKPPDTIRLRQVFLRDPRLYVVAMIRDPRGVITSRHPARPDVYFSSFWRWQRYAQAIIRLSEHPRYLAVRYEDLVASPDSVQALVAQHLPFLRQIRPFSRFPDDADVHETARISLNGLRPIDQASCTRWRLDLPRVKGELVRHPELADWLIRLGYESDTSWTRCLEEVTPVYPHYKNRPPHLLRRLESAARFAVRNTRYLWRRRLWRKHP